jgi:predicted hotdog family 3-hydroxylacyl-ACP dehydratase
MINIEEVVPHSGEMLLIEEIVSHDEDSMVALTTIRESSPFFRHEDDPCTGGKAGVPSWAGLEYMAQTVAALSGLRARNRGERTKPGFFLGAKKYEASGPVFALGCRPRIEVELQDKHNNLGVFSCRIEAGDVRVEALLSVYEGEPPGQTPNRTGKVE